MTTTCLEPIETALSQAASPLSRALRDLSACAGARATCLLIEHETAGETLIAETGRPLGQDETLLRHEHLAVVDLRQDGPFRRLAVLVESSGEDRMLDTEGCGLALAALNVTEALAGLAHASDVPRSFEARIA